MRSSVRIPQPWRGPARTRTPDGRQRAASSLEQPHPVRAKGGGLLRRSARQRDCGLVVILLGLPAPSASSMARATAPPSASGKRDTSPPFAEPGRSGRAGRARLFGRLAKHVLDEHAIPPGTVQLAAGGRGLLHGNRLSPSAPGGRVLREEMRDSSLPYGPAGTPSKPTSAPAISMLHPWVASLPWCATQNARNTTIHRRSPAVLQIVLCSRRSAPARRDARVWHRAESFGDGPRCSCAVAREQSRTSEKPARPRISAAQTNATARASALINRSPGSAAAPSDRFPGRSSPATGNCRILLHWALCATLQSR
jgi:hypothetical protein